MDWSRHVLFVRGKQPGWLSITEDLGQQGSMVAKPTVNGGQQRTERKNRMSIHLVCLIMSQKRGRVCRKIAKESLTDMSLSEQHSFKESCQPVRRNVLIIYIVRLYLRRSTIFNRIYPDFQKNARSSISDLTLYVLIQGNPFMTERY